MLTLCGADTLRWIQWAGLFGLLPVSVACGQGVAMQEAAPVPVEFRSGEVKFNANCARCHGQGHPQATIMHLLCGGSIEKAE